MRSPAWQDRGLYAFLGAWAEMCRDDIPSCPVVVGAEQPQVQSGEQTGYVEPCPEAFARLAAVTDMLKRGLEDRGLAGATVQERLGALYELLLGLRTMAEKELRGEILSAEENAVIAGIGDTLQYLATLPGVEEEEGHFGAGAALASATTVYTDTNYNETLQMAVGKPLTLYVIAPVGGRPALTTGAAYSYFEFVRPADDIITDAAWLEMLGSGQLPERPAWSSSFLR